MTRKRTRRRSSHLGMQHNDMKVSRRAAAEGVYPTRRDVTVKVRVSRAGAPGRGGYHAQACVTGGRKGPYSAFKASHCSGLTGAKTPTKATAKALKELGETIERYGR